MNISVIRPIYKSLLADVSHLLECANLALPDSDEDLASWVTSGGPKLDKQLLRILGQSPVERFWEYESTLKPLSELSVPEWYKPLWDILLQAIADCEIHRLVKVVRHLRTTLVFCYKIEHAPTKQQIEEAQKAFLEAEEGIGVWDSTFDSVRPSPYFRYARQLVQRVLNKGTREDLLKRVFPSHGPGAVYPRRNPRLKTRFTTIYPSIQEFYPFDTWFFPVMVEDLPSKEVQNYIVEREDRTIMCNLTAVPKDSRGPRLICVHPGECIWIQQGQRSWLEGLILTNRLTRGHIAFDDQTGNGERALLSSSALKGISTLDLKEASDRISLKLFRYLFDGFDDILCAARATHVRLMDGRVVELRKFAPMGNCLTFPVESLVFWALCVAAIHCDAKVRPTDANVYVFGDDIQYPPQYHSVVLRRLVESGLVPNSDKTFVDGSFKESCGVDALLGFDVTPLRMKRLIPSSVTTALAYCDLANRAKKRGYGRLSARLFSDLRQFWFVGISNNPACAGLAEYTDAPKYALATWILSDDDIRFNRRFHRWETRVLLPVAVKKRPLNTRWCLVDSLWRLESSSYGGSAPMLNHVIESVKGDRRELALRLYRASLDLPYTSDGGLSYVDPDHVRFITGWTPMAE